MGKRKKKDRAITSLFDIQAGDEVYATSRYQSRILTVDRVTNTQIICGSEKFNKASGYSIPMCAWNPTRLRILTDEQRAIHEADIKKAKLNNYFKTVDWKRLSVHTLTQIKSLIDNDFLDCI